MSIEGLDTLLTEARNPATMNIDCEDMEGILRAINREDQRVALSVEREISAIAAAAERAARCIQSGGRVVYAGAGTSGRLGIVDAAEWYPTFGFPRERVIALLSGGEAALSRSIEGVEDEDKVGEREVAALALGGNDILIGFAASGRTPYVAGAIRRAASDGAATVAVSNNKGAQISALADYAIEIETGPEALCGSTRMKAGTSQKMVLNMISTGAMIYLGKTYSNLMVDLVPTNEKLVHRAKRLVQMAAGVDFEAASQCFERAEGRVKEAIVMLMTGLDYESARKRLEACEGYVRKAVESDPKGGGGADGSAR